MQGKFSLEGLGNFLADHPEECADFIQKARDGLEQITHAALRKIFEKHETDLIYDFNSEVMKVAIPPE